MIYTAETITVKGGRTCTIRSAAPEDAARMLQYMHIMLGETRFLLRAPGEFDYTEEAEANVLAGRMNDPRSLMLLAEVDGQIAACADVRSHGAKSRTWHRADLGMSVRRDYWRLGIGSALMERLIAFAREHDFEQIELEVVAANRRALNLYVKYGFEIYGTRPHGMKYEDGTYANDYMMVKRL